MRSLSPALVSCLNRTALVPADLYEIDIGGTTYRLTSCDRNLTGIAPADVATYTATNVDRERIRSSDGLEVDDLDVTIQHGGSDGLGGKSWVRMALDGDLDESAVRVYRAYLDPTTFSVVGCFLSFAGVVSQVEPGSTEMRIVVAVSANEFGNAFPSLSYQMNCIWNLGGPGCDYAGTLDYTVAVSEVTTSNGIIIASLPGGLGDEQQFVNGTVTAGGFVRTIITAAHTVGGFVFQVSPAFPEPLALSSSATMRLGCHKDTGVCNLHYSNTDHFMGAPMADGVP